jgi:2-oxoglutarate dehydrogenase complex dehydrogenase (E1) component-like enzyme
MIDSFLEGAGISFDEYMDLVREQVPRNIARQKLIDAIGRQYCEEHGLEFTKINPPAEMVAAQKAYIEQLFEQNKDKIEYFIDIPE